MTADKKAALLPSVSQPSHGARPSHTLTTRQILVRAPFILVVLGYTLFNILRLPHIAYHDYFAPSSVHVFATLPNANDPFHFIPCTNATTPPPLDDKQPVKSWKKLYDPEPEHWSWGAPPSNASIAASKKDPYAGRGIYLCGFLDVPLDYTNKSDDRIVRLSVTKYQVSGLATKEDVISERKHRNELTGRGKKSERTLVVNPGGPGAGGSSFVWDAGEMKSNLYSDGQFDVLGWDPRGVNATQPAASCYPYDADRDRWGLFTGKFIETTFGHPRPQLNVADAFGEATMQACAERLGDLPRFLTTAFVARDLEEIRKALGEHELTFNGISYGTGIGETYLSMFPNRAGRIILDGTENIRDGRELGGFGRAALDNVTDAWNDGLLGECLNAGPDYCDLAKPTKDNQTVTLPALQSRMKDLFRSVLERPVPGYVEHSGPVLLTYSALINLLYSSLYGADTWPIIAKMLYRLEGGDATLALRFVDSGSWEYDPTVPNPTKLPPPGTDELFYMVVCGDSYDAHGEDLDWWQALWERMTTQSFLAGNGRFLEVLPCRHFGKHWPDVAEVYRGPLNKTLNFPTLLVAETYDPATPLRNGRRLLDEMGDNARLIVHHGYGHTSRDTSKCTDLTIRDYILHGIVPKSSETNCYADEKPYLYGVNKGNTTTLVGGQASQQDESDEHALALWQAHRREMKMYGFRI